MVVESDDNWLLMFVTPVDSEATVAFVERRPVDNDEKPADVDVDKDATVLLVLSRPVDSELMLFEVDVDRLLTAMLVEFSWLPLTASVLVAEMRPAATFVI
ncbi:ATPase [Burkholderia lata]|uniref:ATPase n=1 Tax=Burkholderia lata (strain ATCC 17760 / DSM 23089 / LMG 22485 / NCIMB 9086 / R18194 / 383) TaxID=482957 RepID=A0A6P2NSY2_BURL3|nr:ATPase [Burkholderia lata]